MLHRTTRVRKGTILPEGEYEVPILQELGELGGRAATTELLAALEPKLDGRLTPLDRKPIASGLLRWKNRAQFAQLHLVRAGDMVKNSPRGVWEITEQGRGRVQSEAAGTGRSK